MLLCAHASDIDACRLLSAGVAGACLLNMEGHAKRIAAQLDILYIAVVEHRTTKEKHIRYLETGKLHGKLAALLPLLTGSASSAAEEAGCSSDPAGDDVAVIDGAAPPAITPQSPSRDGPPIASTASGAEPTMTAISILSQSDVQELLQQRAQHTHNVARLFMRLSSKESEVLKTNAKLFIQGRPGSWDLTTCLFVAQSPSHSLAISVRSRVVAEDTLRDRIKKVMEKAASTSTPSEPLSYARLGSVKFPASEDVSLQQSMDFASLFSNTSSDNTKHTKTPTYRMETIDLSLWSDRSVLQYALQLGMSTEKALLMMLSRTMPIQPPGEGKKKRKDHEAPHDGSAHANFPPDIPEGFDDNAPHALGPDALTFEVLPTTYSLVEDSDLFVQFDKMALHHHAVTVLLFTDAMKMTCMPTEVIKAHGAHLRFRPEHSFQFIDPAFGVSSCTCDSNHAPFPEGRTCCMHLAVFEKVMRAGAPSGAYVGNATSQSDAHFPDLVVCLPTAAAGQELYAVVPRDDLMNAAFVKLMKDNVTCSRSTCGDFGKVTRPEVHASSSKMCYHIRALAVHLTHKEHLASLESLVKELEETNEEEDAEDAELEELFDVGSGRYLFGAYSKYQPFDAMKHNLMHGSFPSEFQASVQRARELGKVVEEYQIGTRTLFALAGSPLLPVADDLCACGKKRKAILDRACVLYTLQGPVKCDVSHLDSGCGLCETVQYTGEQDFVWFLTETLAFHTSLFHTFTVKPLSSNLSDTFTSFVATISSMYAQLDDRLLFVSVATYSKAWFSFYAAHNHNFLQPCPGCVLQGRDGFNIENIGFDGVSLGPQTKYKFVGLETPSSGAPVLQRTSFRDERSPLPAPHGCKPDTLKAVREFMTNLAQFLTSYSAAPSTIEPTTTVTTYLASLGEDGKHLTGFIDTMRHLQKRSKEALLYAPLCRLLAGLTAVDGLIPPKQIDAIENWMRSSFHEMTEHEIILTARSAFDGHCRELLNVIVSIGVQNALLAYLAFACARVRAVAWFMARSAPHPPFSAIPNTSDPTVCDSLCVPHPPFLTLIHHFRPNPAERCLLCAELNWVSGEDHAFVLLGRGGPPLQQGVLHPHDGTARTHGRLLFGSWPHLRVSSEKFYPTFFVVVVVVF